MWLFKLLKKGSLTLSLLLLASCGFKPLYQKENFDQVRGKVNIVVTGNNSDEVRELTGSLERAFLYKVDHLQKTHPYRLEVVINSSTSDFAISRFSYSTRRKVIVSVSFKIIKNSNSQVVDAGGFSDSSSFDLSQSSDYSNDIGVAYANKNSIKTFTDQLVIRCAAVITKETVISDAN